MSGPQGVAGRDVLAFPHPHGQHRRPGTEPNHAAACQETLRLWPQARAAVLFGSRARGTAHPDSDWDVAFVLAGGELRRPRPARSVFPRPDLPAPSPFD
ncbi:MAG: nucleotidyltransferase domain-containing protein [Alphaproteobacteria bacterium]|nr:nucleotidyltransferase domain-containing protein [Alphaproteobacteria bacterium]